MEEPGSDLDEHEDDYIDSSEEQDIICFNKMEEEARADLSTHY